MSAGISIDQVGGDDGLLEFCLFADRVNADRPAHWPVIPDRYLPLLKGEGHDAVGRRVLPLVARSGDEIVARVSAVVDQRYIDHWQERLGHVVMFEAMPDTVDAVRALMNEACAWLRSAGMEAVRAGMGPALEMPFALDGYDSLPPFSNRQNPPYYHSLLKEAGFESEKGWVDYKIEVTPERVALWERMVASAESAGFRVATMAELGEPRPAGVFALVWDRAFARHWGMSPQYEDEWEELLGMLGPTGGDDLSVIAFKGDQAVGAVLGVPDISWLATLAEGRELRPDERLNMLSIGVLEGARGRGVNLAMAARSYLELVKRGSTHVSYTMVLDDNWPSRRTAEKLGGRVCANYMVYRRSLNARP